MRHRLIVRSHFVAERFCSKRKIFFIAVYVNRVQVGNYSTRCCTSAKCNGNEPGITRAFPRDPARMLEAYLAIVKADNEAAIRLGAAKDITDDGVYADRVAVMEGGKRAPIVVPVVPRIRRHTCIKNSTDKLIAFCP
jgi:hypothetical protein